MVMLTLKFYFINAWGIYKPPMQKRSETLERKIREFLKYIFNIFWSIVFRFPKYIIMQSFRFLRSLIQFFYICLKWRCNEVIEAIYIYLSAIPFFQNSKLDKCICWLSYKLYKIFRYFENLMWSFILVIFDIITRPYKVVASWFYAWRDIYWVVVHNYYYVLEIVTSFLVKHSWKVRIILGLVFLFLCYFSFDRNYTAFTKFFVFVLLFLIYYIYLCIYLYTKIGISYMYFDPDILIVVACRKTFRRDFIIIVTFFLFFPILAWYLTDFEDFIDYWHKIDTEFKFVYFSIFILICVIVQRMNYTILGRTLGTPAPFFAMNPIYSFHIVWWCGCIGLINEAYVMCATWGCFKYRIIEIKKFPYISLHEKPRPVFVEEDGTQIFAPIIDDDTGLYLTTEQLINRNIEVDEKGFIIPKYKLYPNVLSPEQLIKKAEEEDVDSDEKIRLLRLRKSSSQLILWDDYYKKQPKSNFKFNAHYKSTVEQDETDEDRY